MQKEGERLTLRGKKKAELVFSPGLCLSESAFQILQGFVGEDSQSPSLELSEKN